MTTYNTTDNQYQGKDKALKAAQALANDLRERFTFKDEYADLNDASWLAYLDHIVVFEDYEGAPAVAWETDLEWAFSTPFNKLEELGHPGFYFEPYYSFLVNIYPI